MKIALAFVGLLVGAGFATGKEVIQYFISFGYWGLAGAVISGIIMSIAGAVILQLGSYFLAREHKFVFNNVSHPIVSRFLDFAVTFTMFTVGIVMIAGAGSTLEQQFGWPAWIGSLAMVVLVMLTGLMDVDKVSSIISLITPFIVIAVIGVFIYSLVNMPSDLGALNELAQQQESPVKPWILSALNYNGLALILGISMCLVIGGSTANPKEVGVGGLLGGLLYTVMLVMSAVALLFGMDKVEGSDVPMLALFESIKPFLASIMVWIIFALIYNTCIGMFYALGRRLTAKKPGQVRTCLPGYLCSGIRGELRGLRSAHDVRLPSDRLHGHRDRRSHGGVVDQEPRPDQEGRCAPRGDSHPRGKARGSGAGIHRRRSQDPCFEVRRVRYGQHAGSH